MFGIDISNWSGPLSPAAVDCFKQLGVGHVVVRASLESPAKQALARQQLQALAGTGIATSAYIWCYWHQDPVQTVEQVLVLLAGVPVSWLWLDAEDETNALAAADSVVWLKHAVDRVRQAGLNVGMYTGAGWWQPHTGDSQAFTALPLWYANFDGAADLSTWPNQSFGAWAAPVGKQYLADQKLCGGIDADFDLFDDVFWGAPGPHTNGTITQHPNFRSGPGTTFPVLRVLDPGTPVTILGNAGDYVHARVAGQDGYVYRDFVQAA